MSNIVFKGYPLEAKTLPKNWNQSAHTSRAGPSSLCHLGVTSDPLIVSKYHNETYDSKGHENQICTIVKGRRRSTAATQSKAPAVVMSNIFFKGYPLEAKTSPKNWNQSAHTSRARPSSLCHLGVTSDPLIVSKFHNETYDSKGHENKIYTIVKGRRRSTAATQSQATAVVMSNIVFKGYPLEAKTAPKN